VKAKELKVSESPPTGDIASQAFSSGTIHLDKKIDEELYEEGIMNEVKRRIQMMRKEAKLVESDSIMVNLSCEKELEAIVRKNEKQLSDAVNAAGIKFTVEPVMTEYEIDGRLLKVAIKKKD
jgi:hypothetical protein